MEGAGARRFTSAGKQHKPLPSNGTRGGMKLGANHKVEKTMAFTVSVGDCETSDGDSLGCGVVQGFRYLLRIHGISR